MEIDITTITAGQMAKARTARIDARLIELRAAIDVARKAIEVAEKEVPEAQQAITNAERELEETIATVGEHLVACGLGIDQRVAAGNAVAAERQFAFRVKDSEPSRIAQGNLNQAKLDLDTIRRAVVNHKNELSRCSAELESFVARMMEI